VGKNQRIRKEFKNEARYMKKKIVQERAKQKFRSTTMPIVKFFSVVLITIALIAGGKYLLENVSGSTKSIKKEEVAAIKTTKGIIKFTFYEKDAPKTTENFKLLTGKKYYDGTKFHRVEPGFVIQGGDPLSRDDNPDNDGQGGESAWGGKFNDELNKNSESYKRGYKQGTVAMANSGENTNGSQFFIMLEDKDEMPKNYSIFGNVIEGMDVVKKIEKGDVMEQVTIETK
jgi:peptidyl-prolyl cis-trans isomerase B (cyclophilin B)